MLVRQLEEELRMRMRQPNIEMQQQMEALYAENEHLTREIAILRDTIKVSWIVAASTPNSKCWPNGKKMCMPCKIRLSPQRERVVIQTREKEKNDKFNSH